MQRVMSHITVRLLNPATRFMTNYYAASKTPEPFPRALYSVEYDGVRTISKTVDGHLVQRKVNGCIVFPPPAPDRYPARLTTALSV